MDPVLALPEGLVQGNHELRPQTWLLNLSQETGDSQQQNEEREIVL